MLSGGRLAFLSAFVTVFIAWYLTGSANMHDISLWWLWHQHHHTGSLRQHEHYPSSGLLTLHRLVDLPVEVWLAFMDRLRCGAGGLHIRLACRSCSGGKFQHHNIMAFSATTY